MQKGYELSVHLAHDETTNRWYVSASDIPGLWLEADTAFALIERIASAAPELIELNAVEIAKAHGLKSDVESIRSVGSRPSIRPIFDSPFELAYA